MMTNGHRLTFLALGSSLAIAFVGSGLMIAALTDGWTRTAGVGPVFMGWIILQYCREKYGRNAESKHQKDSNQASQPIAGKPGSG